MNFTTTSILRIGFIPLADCAPLVIAKELGFFEKENIPVELCKFQNWGQICQRLLNDDIQAAHMLITLPLQISLGHHGPAEPCGYAYTLSQYGNAITLSNRLWNAGVSDALSLAHWLQNEKASEPLRLGIVFPRSTHEYLWRIWLAKAGLAIGDNIVLKVVPPQEMVGQLRTGAIDGFCAGEPWNQRAAISKLGFIVGVSEDCAPPCGEKVLGLKNFWLQQNQEAHAAVLRALFSAAQWLQKKENHKEAATLLSGKRYVNTSQSLLENALNSELEAGGKRKIFPQNFLRFAGEGASYPNPKHAKWYLQTMLRFGHVTEKEVENLNLTAICHEGEYQSALENRGDKA